MYSYIKKKLVWNQKDVKETQIIWIQRKNNNSLYKKP
jgi:hypothetical protein